MMKTTAKPKPALPNLYLDLRTIYTTVPAGALSIGFSAPPLLATLSALTAQPTLSSPSSRNINIDLPLTVDVNDWLSVYGGVSGGSTQTGTSPWTWFDIYSFTLGFQADIYQQNGGTVSDVDHSEQRHAIDFQQRRLPPPATTPFSKPTTR